MATLADRLEDRYAERLGSDWRKPITVTMRADTLYWLVHLIEIGIEAKGKMFRAAGQIGAEEAASLASWQADLEDFVARIEARVKETA